MAVGSARAWYHGWACFVGFAGVNDGGSFLLLLLASAAILLVVCYWTDTCLAVSIAYVGPVSQRILNQHIAGL